MDMTYHHRDDDGQTLPPRLTLFLIQIGILGRWR